MMKVLIEEWRDVIGYEGLYQVSNFGNVKSLDRLIIAPQGKRKVTGVALKPCISNKGYFMVSLFKDNKGSTKTIHSLVAKHFIDNHNNYSDINHIDCNKLNNDTDNLEYCSHKNNMEHASRHGIMGKRNRLEQWEVDSIVNLTKTGYSQHYIAKFLARSQAVVSKYCQRAGIELTWRGEK